MDGHRDFIEFMIQSGVLTFGEFITKSGRKTPYFVNTGNYRTGSQLGQLGAFYAACVQKNIPDKIDALFGPAYKGIPLSVATAIALNERYQVNTNCCYNRKEAKNHGEGGNMIGYRLQDGDNVVIIEDVLTAGTSIRECVPLLKAAADIHILGLVISVDRMEKGAGSKTTVAEIEEEFGIRTYPIVTIREILDVIRNTPENALLGGKIALTRALRRNIEDYIAEYCLL